MLTLGGNRPRAQGMRKLSPGGSRPNCLGKLEPSGFRFLPCHPRTNPAATGATGRTKGAGPKNRDVTVIEATIMDRAARAHLERRNFEALEEG